MGALYLMTAPPPALEGTDAVTQEAQALSVHLGGVVVHMGLSSRPWARLPRTLYGLQRLPALRRLEGSADLIHVYHAELFAFPVLRLLRKPVVYTAVSGLGPRPRESFLRRLGAVAVPRAEDARRLSEMGFQRGRVIRGGIDLERFSVEPAPRGDPFVLLSGSAPWSGEQFQSKGLDTLLAVVQELPFLRLVLLWRGWLLAQIHRRIRERGLADRVEVISERVDVGKVLARAHAAVVLASEPGLVRAYPHSLLEALACGRPVVLSDVIALADDIAHTGCGQVVRGVDAGDLSRAVRRLRQDYETFRARVVQLDMREFSLESVVEQYRDLYAGVTGFEGVRVGPPPSR